jgi:amino acid transporter
MNFIASETVNASSGTSPNAVAVTPGNGRTAPPGAESLEQEASFVEHSGYRQELRRTLRSFSIFAISFSIISITTGIFLNFSFGLVHWGPASIWTWPVVAVGNTLIAFVVAELSTRIPLAGYAYHWSARLVHPTYGWFVGFAGLLYMIVAGGSIALLIATPLLLSEFNVNATPHLVLSVSIVLLLLVMLVNIVSVQVAARVNNVAVFTEILGTVIFAVLLFVLWGVHDKPSSHGWGILFSTTSPSHNPTWYAFVLACLLGAYTLVGFELAASLSEETVGARRSIPRGVILAVVISAVLGMLALLGFTLAIPDIRSVESNPFPLLAIAHYWLTPWLVKVFVAVVVFSMFAILVVGAGAEARLVYAMARDNMMPASRLLRRVNPRTLTPIVALVAFAGINIGVMVYGYFQSSAFLTLVGATAILPYIVYFLITVAYAYKRRVTESVPGAFNLGRFAVPVIAIVLLYTVAVMLILSAPGIFHGSDKVLGYGAAVAAAWYALVLHWRIRRGTATVKPIEQVIERETIEQHAIEGSEETS